MRPFFFGSSFYDLMTRPGRSVKKKKNFETLKFKKKNPKNRENPPMRNAVPSRMFGGLGAN